MHSSSTSNMFIIFQIRFFIPGNEKADFWYQTCLSVCRSAFSFPGMKKRVLISNFQVSKQVLHFSNPLFQSQEWKSMSLWSPRSPWSLWCLESLWSITITMTMQHMFQILTYKRPRVYLYLLLSISCTCQVYICCLSISAGGLVAPMRGLFRKNNEWNDLGGLWDGRAGGSVL